MTAETPRAPARKIADNGSRWPDLQWLMAPAAGCDCQMMALAMADQVGVSIETPAAAGKTAKR